MNFPDLINGFFEGGSGLMCCLNIKALIKDKKIKGVRVSVTAFFTAWGVWNLYYYPHLGQWWSFTGGLLIVVANLAWVCLALHYRRNL